MPHGFEYIVRPFQAPGSLGNIVIPGTPQRTTELARVVWGGQGTMPSTKILNPSTQVNVCHETAKELSRDAPTERIIGSDGESYVDVARVQSMKLDKLESKTDQTLSVVMKTLAKVDPRLADDPNFRQAQANTEQANRCELGWSFKPAINRQG